MNPKIKDLLMLTGAVLILVLFNGCALTTDYVPLSYVPMAGTAKVAGADKVRVNVDVHDERAIKDRVGVKKNGYGMEMAPIISQVDVTGMVQKALAAELENRGFQLADGNLTILVELNRFYNDFKAGFWSGDAVAELTMEVQIKKPGGEIVFTKLVEGQGVHRNIQLASGSNAKVALEAALKDGVAKLFADPTFVPLLVKSAEETNVVSAAVVRP